MKVFKYRNADNKTEVEIPHTNILEADRIYEKLTGINPVKFHGHTPPILVSIHNI